MTASTVLYIEDEEDYQILVRRILHKRGLNVCLAGTGADGTAAIKQFIPNLIILDINLPDTDGYSLCKSIRQDPETVNVPVLMLTVRRRPDEWLRGFSCGIDDYLSKPFNPAELIDRVNAFLGPRSGRSSKLGTSEFLMVQAALKGNRKAFEVLSEQYRERLTNALFSFRRGPSETDDIVADAFARAYERLGQFRGEASFYTWLYRIALNEARLRLRESPLVSLEGPTNSEEKSLALVGDKSEHPDTALINTSHQAQVHAAIAVIPRPYRQMLRWHFIRGMSYHSMSKRLKIPHGTVMSRLFRARQLLRKAWAAQERGGAG